MAFLSCLRVNMPRRWCWFALLLLFFATTCAEIRQLPYCPDSTTSRSLLFVSTLDGKLTALDAAANGEKKWSLEFQKEPLLSSNIHRRDLNNNGQWVRLIPSLSGGLYKFDGDTLEPVPVSVDNLLQSSFRYSEDMIFSGGKETKTYGISSKSGKILYECKMSRCTNATDGESVIEEDILIVRRHQHTVRAGEPRSGVERWNFSVGQHDLTMLPREHSDCHQETLSVNLDIEIRAIIPEGLVVAFSRTNPTVKLWEYKFDSPVVSVWREDQVFDSSATPLKQVNLFESSQLDLELDPEYSTSPGLYIGMHERQLYIQENPALKAVDQSKDSTVKYPWRPYPAIEFAKDVGNDNSNDVPFEMSEVLSTTALSVLYNSEYINGNGFYLYSKQQIQIDEGSQCNGTVPKNIFTETSGHPSAIEYPEEDNIRIEFITVGLWYYWREVGICCLTTGIVVWVYFKQMHHLDKKDLQEAAAVPQRIYEYITGGTSSESRASTSKDNTLVLPSSYKSRYIKEYEHVGILGKGGYGIVFEAMNKFDCQNYAIKRIALPHSESSQQRMMREVRALATLEHYNIVRYFNSWVEDPPLEWQETMDRALMKKKSDSTCGSASLTGDTSNCTDVPPTETPSTSSAVDALEEYANDEEDSIIVFEKTNQKSDKTDDVEEEETTKTNQRSTGTAHSSVGSKQENQSDNIDESILFEESKNLELAEKKSKHNVEVRTRKHSPRPNTKMLLYIQMELCRKLSLKEWLIEQNSQRDIFRVLNIFKQIVDGVHCVHLKGLMHRDLKPSNIFFAVEGIDRIKIGDFGLVTAMTEDVDEADAPIDFDENNVNKTVHTACVGTHLYMSPEQVNGKNYNYKIDIYSLGIILFELLCPFSTNMERAITLEKLRMSIFPDNFSLDFPAEYDLLKMMLADDPVRRPTTIGIRAHHPFLATPNSADENEWYFELPPLSRNASFTSSNGAESGEQATE